MGTVMYMKDFFKYDFSISKIELCAKVSGNAWERVHRNRPYHGLVFKLSGENTYDFPEVSHTVRGGNVIYLPKFSDYNVNGLGDCIAINFNLCDENVTFSPFTLSDKYADKYKALFEKALDIVGAKHVGYSNALMSVLYDIIQNIQKDSARAYLSGKNSRLAEDIHEYIQLHFTEKSLSVEMLAKHFSVSCEYLRMIFRNAYGIQPKKYIVILRTEYAKKLIRSGDIKLTQVGEMCGFDSASYFSSKFRLQTGMTPSEYKTSIG